MYGMECPTRRQRRSTSSWYQRWFQLQLKELEKVYARTHYPDVKRLKQEMTTSVHPYSQAHHNQHHSVSGNSGQSTNVLPSVSGPHTFPIDHCVPTAFYQAQMDLLGVCTGGQLKPTNFWSLGGANVLNYDVASTTQTASPVESVTPFVTSPLSPPPRPKDEVMDLEELEQIPLVSGIEQVEVKPMTQNAEFVETRCATCQEYVPRNLVSIRDHVKVHFGEKTSCMPVDDLTKLLPTLQHRYYQLLMTSFPFVHCFLTPIKAIKPIICDICGLRTNNKWNLFNHIKNVHMSGKLRSTNYICDICGMTTNWKNSLVSHINRAHISGKIKPNYICDICGYYETIWRGRLFSHINHAHIRFISSKCSTCVCYDCQYNRRKHRSTL